ncbi:MAG: YebC/PmpR family DNA-binding transcriptional regulator [Armatimonadetes bacterium]|nr:YebC/PmpR family DNA-binding transcriptional regulator [Armatimonadota bacterium]
MSGHSKWHNIRLKKGKMDAERGAKFTKLAREIIVAAKAGGANPDANLRLRLAIQKARENSMPADKIKNAVQRGTGEIDGAAFEELIYEGYGPGGVALLVECATDNKNRTVADVRSIFTKHGGRLGETGSVSYLFGPQVGLIEIAASATDEDTLLGVALEAGAEDVKTVDGGFEVLVSPGDMAAVTEALATAKIHTEAAEITMIPLNSVHVAGKEAQQVIKMIDLLEEHDDVQRVHTNVDISEEDFEAA